MISTAGSPSTVTVIRMNEKAVGLILKEQDYKENAVILTVLFEEYGKLSLVAQGARKMSSKNRGNILPYTKGEFSFDYREGKTMFRMKTAHTLELYRFLHEDLNASLACAVLAEVINAFLMEGAEPSFSDHCFKLFEEACTAWNTKHPADIVLAVSLADILKTQGIAPDVDECVLCGDTSVSAISVNDGGFLCASCAMKRNVRFSEPMRLRAFRLINKAKLEHLPVLEEAMGSALKECDLLAEFIRTHAGLPLRSYTLFQRMFQETEPELPASSGVAKGA